MTTWDSETPEDPPIRTGAIVGFIVGTLTGGAAGFFIGLLTGWFWPL